MADISLSIGLDTTELQQGAKTGADSLGEMYDKMAKLQTAGEKRNAIYEYINNADVAAKELLESAKGLNAVLSENTQTQSGNTPKENQTEKTAADFATKSTRATEILKNANIDQLKSQVEIVNEKLGEMYDKMAGMNSMDNDFASMSETIARLEEVKRGLNADISRLENGKDRLSNNGNNGIFAMLRKGVFGVPSMINNAGNGNIASLAIQGLTAGAGALEKGGSAAAAAEGGAATAGLSSGLLAAGGIALVAALVAAGGNALANQWEKNADNAVDMQSLYGRDIENKSKQQNSEELRTLYNDASAKNYRNATGYTTQEFIQLANSLSKFGINNSYSAMNNAADIMSWQRWSGADRNTLATFAGTAMRYGAARTANNALNPAYAALEQSGMQKGQFSEMLSAIQSVLEEGIANGFVKSTDEIANNLSMLYKLSGNSVLWQGQNGAQRLSQMSSSLADSTELSTASQVMNYQAANRVRANMLNELSDERTSPERRNYIKKQLKGIDTGTYVDTMMLMEKGLSPDILKAQFDVVGSLEGGNTAGIIERFRQMYGLNYTGAKQVYDMYEKSKNGNINWESFYKSVDNIKQNTNYQSEETSYKTAIESIKNEISKMGQDLFSIREKIVGGSSVDKQIEDAKEDAANYAPALPALDRTYQENGQSYQNYNPVNDKWGQLVKEGLVFDAVEVIDTSSPMSRTEWASSDGLFGKRTLTNYKEGLESGEAYHSKMLTGEDAKGFFFNADDMEKIREQESNFRLPDSDSGADLSEKEKAILNEMYKEMYKRYSPNATNAQIERFLQIIAANTAQNNEPITIELTIPN